MLVKTLLSFAFLLTLVPLCAGQTAEQTQARPEEVKPEQNGTDAVAERRCLQTRRGRVA